MEKRGDTKIAKAMMALVILVLVIHITAHFMIYGTGVKGFGEKGVSGLSIGSLEIDGKAIDAFRSDNPESNNISKYIIAGEWVVLIAILLYILVKGKMKLDKEIKSEELTKREIRPHRGNETDIDILYDLLKEKKEIRLAVIAKSFGVSESTALEWCKILEEGDLATLKYPTVGSPKLVLIGEENEKAKA